MTRPLLGIALGGGGVRGAAHVGVLQEIDNAGIKVDRISGVSAGAVIGCLYAYSLDGKWVEDHFREIWSSQSFNGLTSKIFFDLNRKSEMNFGPNVKFGTKSPSITSK